jgi:catechol 2,3-dioxygenase-like lactoylglutathione lyase family enzyme
VTPLPSICQLALCTRDLPRTAQLYGQGLGFADSGGKPIAGEWLARIQGLGDDAATMLAWQVGRQDFFQLEFFCHTDPVPRPLPEDWRPCDLGWVRFGVAVPDFAAALARLSDLGVVPLIAPVTQDGLRRAAFRDPHAGIVVEVMEDGAALPGGVRPRFYDLAPAVVYAALSVPDLDRARTFWIDTVGLEAAAVELHRPEHEALWGLTGARSESLVLRGGGDILLELVRYGDPVGRSRPAGHRVSDQGLMNIAVGSRDPGRARALLARVAAAGYAVNAPLPETPAGGTYCADADGNSLEILSAPREFDPTFGFVPLPGLLRPAAWPAATVGPAQ